ncbi:Endo/exonuclease/phosphatase domain-containing protein [Chloropicon roscoffensis]|uniref:Endo/exonuclease/phosphatase domain-containing protein n=2 Tax=Chloropicon roscoffensis TaxID=1461544 RepID=A0AAX4P1N5_9CHLO
MLSHNRCKRLLARGGVRLTTRARLLALSTTSSVLGGAFGSHGRSATGVAMALGASKETSSSSSDNVAAEDELEGDRTFLGRLKVLTFNLLAPCYFRSDGVYESTIMNKTLRRHKCIIEVLREQRCDVCCLQEFWFNDYLRDLYQEELGHLYSISSLQRTRSEDGVAILMLKEKFHVVNQQSIYFREHSKFGHDRVALVVLAQLANMEGAEEGSQATAPSSRGKCSPPVAFVTSHLTYPHHTLDEYSRLEQSKVMLGKSKEFVEGSCPPGTPIIIAGDFNGTLEDQVSNQMRSSGYLDAFSEAEGPERSSRRITHCDHRKEQKGVDYIWVSQGAGAGAEGDGSGEAGGGALVIQDPPAGANAKRDPGAQSKINMLPFDGSRAMELGVAQAYLLPRDVPWDTKMHRPKFGMRAESGEGPVVSTTFLGDEDDFHSGKLTLNSYDSYDNIEEPSVATDLDWRSWCNLSDHRPLVVEFDVFSTDGRQGS